MRRCLVAVPVACLLVPLLALAAARVQVRTLTLVDTGLPAATVQDIEREFNGKTFSSRDEFEERVRDAFQRRGYFEAIVEDPKFTVVAPTPDAEVVDATVYVEPGRIYHLAAVTFEHGTAFAESELRRQIPIADGDVFDIEKVRQGLEYLRILYCAYLNFTPVPETQVDERAATIRLTMDLDEGAVYRTGQLLIQGQGEPGARDRLLAAWKPFEGRVYDCDVLSRFLREIHARPAIKPEDIFTLSLDAQAHVVNVSINLAQPLQP